MRQNKTKKLVMVALFAAIICVSSYISIPLPFSPVPLTLQTFAIMLAGLILLPMEAAASVGVFLLIGIIGVPVFSGGSAGIGVLLGPTGGYLVGFLVGAIVISLLKGDEISFVRMLMATALGGVVVVYAIGVPWLANATGMGLSKAFTVGAVPFLIGDVIKVFVAVSAAGTLRRQLKHIL